MSHQSLAVELNLLAEEAVEMNHLPEKVVEETNHLAEKVVVKEPMRLTCARIMEKEKEIQEQKEKEKELLLFGLSFCWFCQQEQSPIVSHS